jgi:hypothetical protein
MYCMGSSQKGLSHIWHQLKSTNDRDTRGHALRSPPNALLLPVIDSGKRHFSSVYCEERDGVEKIANASVRESNKQNVGGTDSPS